MGAKLFRTCNCIVIVLFMPNDSDNKMDEEIQ